MVGRSHLGPRFALAPAVEAVRAALGPARSATAVPVTPRATLSRKEKDRLWDDGYRAGKAAGLRGQEDAVLAESRRCEAILTSSEGRADPDMAFRLAFRSGSSVKEARRVMREVRGSRDAHAEATAAGWDGALAKAAGERGGAARASTAADGWSGALAKATGKRGGR